MDLIDHILSSTREYSMDSNIVSEQNDSSKIDIGGGAKADLASRIASIRNGGGWDAAEYGITADEQIARLEATQGNPEALAREDEILRQRALRRAGLDTTGGKVRVMVAGIPAWHRLGVNVREAVDSVTAERLSGTDFTVDKVALGYKWNGEDRLQDDAFGLVRQDNGECLGVVGSRYKVIQNADAFKFMDSLVPEFDARYETAGSVYGGKRVWMQLRLPRSAFEVGRGDKVEAFALFTNPHDGSGLAWCLGTSNRVVCNNTLRIAMNCKKDAKGIGFRHTGDIKSKLAEARKALGLAVKGFETLKQSAEVLVAKDVNALGGMRMYTDCVLDEVLDVKAADVQAGPEMTARRVFADVTTDDFVTCVEQCRKQIETRGEILADILNRFESERCKVNGITGTAWAALNAVTEHADYAKPKRQASNQQVQLSRRFDSVLTGDADDMKQAAFQVAMRA